MITLPTNHPYFFTCPSCGCKLISVSSGVKTKPHCPECDYSADDAFVVKDRVMNEAMNVIADNAELAENFAETVKNEIASDDDAYAHIGFHLANDIRNQSPASEVLLTLCGGTLTRYSTKRLPSLSRTDAIGTVQNVKTLAQIRLADTCESEIIIFVR